MRAECISIGIDPGADGAVAWLRDGPSGREVGAERVDTKNFLRVREILSRFRPLTAESVGSVHVGIEGIGAQPKFSTRTLVQMGRAVQGAEDAALASGIPLSWVASKEWQAVAFAGSRTREKDPKARKRSVVRIARERWPQMEEALSSFAKGSGVADALFVALVIQRREFGGADVNQA